MEVPVHDARPTEITPHIEIRRSKRKTLAIEVASAHTVIVRAPHGLGQGSIDRFLSERAQWIDRARCRWAAREAASGLAPSAAELASMRRKARTDLTARVDRWAPLVGAQPAQIQVRNQRSRWGSCSTTGTLSLNLQLMRLPEWVRDYVVVHELAHLVHPNHGPEFWLLVERVYPRFRAARSHLREVVLFR